MNMLIKKEKHKRLYRYKGVYMENSEEKKSEKKSERTHKKENTLRIFHTGDLHVGQNLLKQCRLEEHRRLFRWLCDEIKKQEIHVLLISGDLFDKAQPRPDAQRVFFNFLAEHCISLAS